MKNVTRAFIVSFASVALVNSGFISPTQAASLTWNIQDAMFEDGGILTGSFDYDAETRTYSNINLTVSGGLLDGFLYQGGLCGAIPIPGQTCLPDRSQNPDQFLIEVFAQSGYEDSAGVKGWLFMSFLQPLTSEGGTIPFFNAGELWYRPQGGDTHRAGQRAIVRGNVTTSGAAVPEPMTMAGLALAGAGLTWVRRRKHQVDGSKPIDEPVS